MTMRQMYMQTERLLLLPLCLYVHHHNNYSNTAVNGVANAN